MESSEEEDSEGSEDEDDEGSEDEDIECSEDEYIEGSEDEDIEGIVNKDDEGPEAGDSENSEDEDIEDSEDEDIEGSEDEDIESLEDENLESPEDEDLECSDEEDLECSDEEDSEGSEDEDIEGSEEEEVEGDEGAEDGVSEESEDEDSEGSDEEDDEGSDEEDCEESEDEDVEESEEEDPWGWCRKKEVLALYTLPRIMKEVPVTDFVGGYQKIIGTLPAGLARKESLRGDRVPLMMPQDNSSKYKEMLLRNRKAPATDKPQLRDYSLAEMKLIDNFEKQDITCADYVQLQCDHPKCAHIRPFNSVLALAYHCSLRHTKPIVASDASERWPCLLCSRHMWSLDGVNTHLMRVHAMVKEEHLKKRTDEDRHNKSAKKTAVSTSRRRARSLSMCNEIDLKGESAEEDTEGTGDEDELPLKAAVEVSKVDADERARRRARRDVDAAAQLPQMARLTRESATASENSPSSDYGEPPVLQPAADFVLEEEAEEVVEEEEEEPEEEPEEEEDEDEYRPNGKRPKKGGKKKALRRPSQSTTPLSSRGSVDTRESLKMGSVEPKKCEAKRESMEKKKMKENGVSKGEAMKPPELSEEDIKTEDEVFDDHEQLEVPEQKEEELDFAQLLINASASRSEKIQELLEQVDTMREQADALMLEGNDEAADGLLRKVYHATNESWNTPESCLEDLVDSVCEAVTIHEMVKRERMSKMSSVTPPALAGFSDLLSSSKKKAGRPKGTYDEKTPKVGRPKKSESSGGSGGNGDGGSSSSALEPRAKRQYIRKKDKEPSLAPQSSVVKKEKGENSEHADPVTVARAVADVAEKEAGGAMGESSEERPARLRKRPRWMMDEEESFKNGTKGQAASVSNGKPPAGESADEDPLKEEMKKKKAESKRAMTERTPAKQAQHKRVKEEATEESNHAVPPTPMRPAPPVEPLMFTPRSGKVVLERMRVAADASSSARKRKQQLGKSIDEPEDILIVNVNATNSGPKRSDLTSVPVYLSENQQALFFAGLKYIRMSEEDGFREGRDYYQCVYCDMKLPNIRDGRRHMVAHLRVMRLRCGLCGAGAFFCIDMRNHLQLRGCPELSRAPPAWVRPGTPCMSKEHADQLTFVAHSGSPGRALFTSGKIVSILSNAPYLPDPTIEEKILGPLRVPPAHSSPMAPPALKFAGLLSMGGHGLSSPPARAAGGAAAPEEHDAMPILPMEAGSAEQRAAYYEEMQAAAATAAAAASLQRASATTSPLSARRVLDFGAVGATPSRADSAEMAVERSASLQQFANFPTPLRVNSATVARKSPSPSR